MSVENKTIEKLQTIEKLINELVEMRHQIIELKASEMQRQMTVAALQSLENKYKTLIENLPQKIFVKDRNSAYLSCNQSLARDLKIKAEEIVGKTDFDFFPKEVAENYKVAEARVMESGQAEETEEKYAPAGQELIVRMIRVPLRDEKGEITGVLGTFWDITAEKRKEEEVKREIAQKAEKMQELNNQLAELKERLEREIEQRNILEEEYKQNKLSLEGKLLAKQEELKKTNEQLQKEIAEHRKVADELQKVAEEFLRTKTHLEEEKLAYTKELKALQEEREKDRAEPKRLQEELVRGQEKISSLEKQVAENQEELAKVKEQLTQEINRLKAVEEDLEKEKGKVGTLQKELIEKAQEIVLLTEKWQKEESQRQQVEEAWKKREEEFARLLQETNLTSEMGRVMASTMNLQEIYEHFSVFAGEVRRLIPFDRLSTSLINPEDNTLQISYAWGTDLADWPVGEVRPLSGSSAEEVMRTRTTLLIQEENQEAARERFPDISTYLAAGFQSLLFVPLSFREQVLGVLNILSKEKNAYNKDDLRLAEKIAAQMAGALGKGRQILEQQRKEEILRASEQKFRSMVEGAPVGVWISREGEIIYANARCEEVLGYSSTELTSKNLAALLHHHDKDRILELIAKWEKGEGPPSSYVGRFNHKDGQVKWLENKTALLPWEGKSVVIHFLNDVTQRKNLEESLRQSIEPFRKLVQAVENIVTALREEAQ